MKRLKGPTPAAPATRFVGRAPDREAPRDPPLDRMVARSLTATVTVDPGAIVEDPLTGVFVGSPDRTAEPSPGISRDLPFVAAPPPAPQRSSTVVLQAVTEEPPARPRRPRRDDETLQIESTRDPLPFGRADALPFAPASSRAPAPPPTSSRAPVPAPTEDDAPDSTRTRVLPSEDDVAPDSTRTRVLAGDAAAAAVAALPFVAPAAPRPAPAALAPPAPPDEAGIASMQRALTISLVEYAGICAWMQAAPDSELELRRKWGLDEAAWSTLHTIWQERFERDPALPARFRFLVDRLVGSWR